MDAAVRQTAIEAMLARVNTGEPFKTSELREIARRQGDRHACGTANSLTQGLKARGAIVVVGNSGPANIWQKRADPPLTAPEGPTVVAPRMPEGPFDPPAALEGPNMGLTEAIAERLWKLLGGGQTSLVTMEEGTNVIEATGWRWVALGLVDFMLGAGFRPPGEPREAPNWTPVWHYDLDMWEILDNAGGAVCLVPNNLDVPLLLAAPRMAAAIKEMLARVNERGGVKRSDIEALRESIKELSTCT